jgi:hypothetical protein
MGIPSGTRQAAREASYAVSLTLCEEEHLMLRLSLYKAILLAAFGALQIADVITTKRVLDNGGWEANPLAVLAMALLGNYWPIPKLILMTICMAWMIRWKLRYVAPFVALMGLIVANNALWAYS